MNTYLEKVVSIANQNKYTKYYSLIIENALKRPQDRKLLKEIFGYVESHHILPESFGLGGEKDRENLVLLTAKEHFVVHLCATKMFESVFKNKMVFAFRQLRSSNKYQGNRYTSSRLYALIKPDFKSFVRLYKDRMVKYLYESQIEQIANLEENGWSKKMTPEYKEYCVGKVPKGLVRSEETRRKLSLALKGKPRPHTRGRKMSQETKDKVAESRRRKKEERPEEYEASLKRMSEAQKKCYKEGRTVPSGENNPNFGKKHTEESKRRMSQGAQNKWDNLKADPSEFEKYKESRTLINRKTWESQELRDKCKIIRSKAYLQHGMNPKDYYDQKLKPLLYLGFLPTAIIKYKLLDIHAGSVKLWVKRYGSTEDMAQFNENKKKAAGANKAYIQFQEDQYNKYFKDKIETIL